MDACAFNIRVRTSVCTNTISRFHFQLGISSSRTTDLISEVVHNFFCFKFNETRAEKLDKKLFFFQRKALNEGVGLASVSRSMGAKGRRKKEDEKREKKKEKGGRYRIIKAAIYTRYIISCTTRTRLRQSDRIFFN